MASGKILMPNFGGFRNSAKYVVKSQSGGEGKFAKMHSDHFSRTMPPLSPSQCKKIQILSHYYNCPLELILTSAGEE